MNEFFIALICMATVVTAILYIRRNRVVTRYAQPDNDRFQMEAILHFVRDAFNDILKTNLYEMSISREEFEKRLHNKNQLRKALKTCTYGDTNSKNYIKDFIKDILVKSYGMDESNINRVINFDNPAELTVQDKFEILLYQFKKMHGYRALEALFWKTNSTARRNRMKEFCMS